MNPSRTLLAAVIAVAILARASLLVAQDVEPAHFHHVMLNVTDPEKTIKFYHDVFGATPVKFRGVSDALFTERSFLLFNKVDAPPVSKLNTGIWHIGWGGVDVKNEYEWWKRKGVDIHTPLSPLPGPDNYYMYISGPDKELIEINTMGHHRFGHVHFFCSDVNETADWYAKHLGLKPRRAAAGQEAHGRHVDAGGHLDQRDPVRQCDDDLLRQARRQPRAAVVEGRAARWTFSRRATGRSTAWRFPIARSSRCSSG